MHPIDQNLPHNPYYVPNVETPVFTEFTPAQLAELARDIHSDEKFEQELQQFDQDFRTYNPAGMGNNLFTML